MHRMARLGPPEFREPQTGPPRLPSQERTEQPSCSGLAYSCMAAGRVSQAERERERGAINSFLSFLPFPPTLKNR